MKQRYADADKWSTLRYRQKCVILGGRDGHSAGDSRQSDLLASNIPRDPHLR